MNPITSFLVALCTLAGVACGVWLNPLAAAPFFVLAAIAMSLKMANVWEKFVCCEWASCKASRVRGSSSLFR
jgi:glucose dehydrogenase